VHAAEGLGLKDLAIHGPADCFKTHRPTIVPARTLLSQLP
jgi:hypothetical protein